MELHCYRVRMVCEFKGPPVGVLGPGCPCGACLFGSAQSEEVGQDHVNRPEFQLARNGM